MSLNNIFDNGQNYGLDLIANNIRLINNINFPDNSISPNKIETGDEGDILTTISGNVVWAPSSGSGSFPIIPIVADVDGININPTQTVVITAHPVGNQTFLYIINPTTFLWSGGPGSVQLRFEYTTADNSLMPIQASVINGIIGVQIISGNNSEGFLANVGISMVVSGEVVISITPLDSDNLPVAAFQTAFISGGIRLERGLLGSFRNVNI